MNIREIEEIESGLKILSYECDDLLDHNFYGNNLMNLYFLYNGFITDLKRKKWTLLNIKHTLKQFPKLVQPGIFIIIPFLLYSTGLYFASSLPAIMIYLFLLSLALTVSYIFVKKKIRRDLVRIIILCTELRNQLHEAKKLMKVSEV